QEPRPARAAPHALEPLLAEVRVAHRRGLRLADRRLDPERRSRRGERRGERQGVAEGAGEPAGAAVPPLSSAFNALAIASFAVFTSPPVAAFAAVSIDD